MRSIYLYILIFTLCISCDSLTDCIIASRPELKSKAFETAFTDQYYEHLVKAEIDNNPLDNDFYYFFTVSGLPVGMDYEVYGRDVLIYGTPHEEGRYIVQIQLYVEPIFWDDSYDGDNLCEDTTTKNYPLLIQ